MPEVEFEGRMCSLFTPISPTHCIICGSPLKPNEYYNRFAISSYGIIRCPVSYWICSNPDCKKHYHDSSAGRGDATARGGCYTIREAANEVGLDLKGATVAIQGYGNAGYFAATLVYSLFGETIKLECNLAFLI